ncbi:hypothetical protein CDD83_1834 [Cordyceps sp. RAO-2017]|nr:hypothetical protein CDD83_1834 [Cordyceps sp. RAO-2017]
MHRVPPPRPAGRGALPHLAEALFLLVCHFWFTAACFLVPARPRGEALADYLARTWLPRRYVSHYLLPLLSSVSTCTHAELLAFPASDVIAYKKLSHGQQHFAVCGGVHQVQSRLAKGVDDIRLACTVTAVEARKDGLLVRWQPTGGPGRPRASEQRFDRVVLAVSPDVAARLFRPLAAALGKMPTRRVESSIRSPRPGAFSLAAANESAAAAACSHHRGSSWPAQVITFRTLFAGDESRTQAVHAMPSGVLVSTSPLEAAADPKAVLRTASFTRTLRTPESRATVQSIMGHGRWQDGAGDVAWVNGQDNLWLAGSWCWDGMVLLEGCVVSAMRVARDFGVRVPWREE